MSSQSEEISKLKSEVETLKKELCKLKRAILNTPDLGEKVQKKLWEQ
jgi:hypothetical protein